MIIERTNTILYCTRWSETVDFYRRIFAFKVNYQNEWFVEFQITSSSFLSIADRTRATIDSVEGQGITLSWQVANVEKVHAELEAQGIDATPIKQKWGASLFYLHDPEGHRIELWQAE